MRILALETSTDHATCALWCDGVVTTEDCGGDAPSSETLLPAIQRLLSGAGLTLGDLDGIAFGAGPGSFTGVRVACGVAQGLGFVHGLPLLPVSTLAAVALATGDGEVLALLDARMKEVYCGRFRVRAGAVDALDAATVATPAEVVLPATGSAWYAGGNAPAAYPVLAERLAAAGIPLRSAAGPRACQVAEIGARMLAAGQSVSAAEAAPHYVRDQVAQTIAERLAAGGKA